MPSDPTKLPEQVLKVPSETRAALAADELKELWNRAGDASHPNLEQYEQLAEELVKSWKSGDPKVVEAIRKRHPRLRNLSDADIRSAEFTLADAQLLIARDLSFESWVKFAEYSEAVTRTNSAASQFEAAVEAIVTGDVATLERLLSENPELIRARSTRMHRATLLHYVAANGVERQRSPKNAVEVAKILLKAGAEVDALADTYGADKYQTTMNLLVSSCHPAKAGVQAALVETLLDFGAAINGLEDDGSPLITALAFHYTAAAEALARRGARVDNIVAAAALGREDLVRRFIDDGGSLKADVPLLAISWLRLPKDSRANLDLALVWAAMHHRTGMVELLLQKGVDPGARDNRRWTGLHWAAYYGYLDTLQLLLKWNAPLEAENEFGGTVLGQTTWCVINEPQDYQALIIEALLDAGAKVDAADYRTGNKRIDEVLRRHGAKSE